jgi:glycosyltransferase involved in cell wall biosynthesis
VDLVTYPFGRDIELPGLRVFRCARPPLVTGIGIGPSWRKLPLDLALLVTACRRAMTDKYDAVHSHEEGSWFGVVLAGLLGVPHLYDMHSSLPQQLTNFAYSNSRAVKAVFGWLERFVVRRSRVVIVICPQLEEVVRGIDTAVPSVLIENSPGSGDSPVEGSGAAVRRALGIDAKTPMVLYTGTFEAYQGLDLLFAAMKKVLAERPDARLVLAGGRPEQVEAAQRQAVRSGIGAATVFAGQRPAEEIPAFLDAADVLVSPRSLGTNTPLKIYQYLRSGRAIVATRLLTHTQVLDDDVSLLTAATPEGFAAGILAAVNDPERARAIGSRARQLAETKYSYEAYLARTRQACAHLFGEHAPEMAGGVA